MEALKPRKGRLKEFMFNSFGFGDEKQHEVLWSKWVEEKSLGTREKCKRYKISAVVFRSQRKAWEHEKNVNVIK